MSILDLPVAMPEVVLGLSPLLLFGKNPLGVALAELGVRIVFTKLGVVVAEFFTAATLRYKSALLSIRVRES